MYHNCRERYLFLAWDLYVSPADLPGENFIRMGGYIMTDPLEALQKNHMQKEVSAYLDRLSRKGTRISMEGYNIPLKQMARVISLSEGICYMPDYLTDEKGNLVEIRFDRVYLT